MIINCSSSPPPAALVIWERRWRAFPFLVMSMASREFWVKLLPLSYLERDEIPGDLMEKRAHASEVLSTGSRSATRQAFFHPPFYLKKVHGLTGWVVLSSSVLWVGVHSLNSWGVMSQRVTLLLDFLDRDGRGSSIPHIHSHLENGCFYF